MPARSYTPPSQWVTRGGIWPEGPFHEEAPPYAAALGQFVVQLRDAINTASLRSVAARAGISHASLSRILHGETVPDTATLAALEHALGTPLWRFPDS